MSLTRTSLIIFTMRFSNMGLMMIGPLVLARLLSVYEFGQYREFLVYSGALMTISAFGLSAGLMYLVPAHPERTWALVGQTATLTAVSALVFAGIAAGVNLLAGGGLYGPFGQEALIYALLYVSLDFWEYFFLAQKKAATAFYYTSGRLALRLTTVTIVAVVTHSIHAVIYSLLIIEMLRVVSSAVAWKLMYRPEPAGGQSLWAVQLRYSFPLGISLLLETINNYAGSILISMSLGAIALAHYSVGTYAVPVLYMLRNSVSDALLPHMATHQQSNHGSINLEPWHRANTIFAMVLIPVGILLARYAETIVVVLFSERYVAAVVVFQLYLITVLTKLVDFGVLLRLFNRTRVFLYSTAASIAINIILLVVLMPSFGLTGAIIAAVVAAIVAEAIHTWAASDASGIRPYEILGLRNILRVGIAAILPLPLLLVPARISALGILEAAAIATLYIAAYLFLLWRTGTTEIRELLLVALRRLPARLHPRRMP